jgi:hypothetical protein
MGEQIAAAKYGVHTKSASDGADVRWYFCKIPLRPNGIATATILMHFVSCMWDKNQESGIMCIHACFPLKCVGELRNLSACPFFLESTCLPNPQCKTLNLLRDSNRVQPCKDHWRTISCLNLIASSKRMDTFCIACNRFLQFSTMGFGLWLLQNGV